MKTTNRILLARGPNGSNLDQIFDVDIKSNEQNILKLKYLFEEERGIY